MYLCDLCYCHFEEKNVVPFGGVKDVSTLLHEIFLVSNSLILDPKL